MSCCTIGGTLKKNFHYYVYNHSARSADRWNKTEKYTIRNTHAFFRISFTQGRNFRGIPIWITDREQSGGLTDAQFEANPQPVF
jgi:hypothetical protein